MRHQATIGIAQARVLDALSDGAPRRKADLVEVVGKGVQHAYKVASRLLARGFVRPLARLPERAGQRVIITPRGYEALARWREDGGKI